MFINDLIQSDENREELLLLAERCDQFLEESNSLPLLKNLPSEYGDFHKVKVRKRRLRKEDTQEFAETFNDAFDTELNNLRERAVFANGEESFEPADTDELEPFFVFPIDGFKYMFSQEVENSSHDYKKVFDALFEEFGSNKGNEVITELLKFTYKTTNLTEGISQGSEIIIYNIPYFYAIRVNSTEDYQHLLNSIAESM